MNEVLGVEVDIKGGKEVVGKVRERLEEMEESGELNEKKLEMEKELGLKKEISPQKKELINGWKREKKNRMAKLEEIKKQQEKPIISNIEKGTEKINKT